MLSKRSPSEDSSPSERKKGVYFTESSLGINHLVELYLKQVFLGFRTGALGHPESWDSDWSPILALGISGTLVELCMLEN